MGVSTQSTWELHFLVKLCLELFSLILLLIKENGINIVHCYFCNLIGMFVDKSFSNNRLGHSLCQRSHQGHQRAQLTSTAQEWADHLASSCQFDHRPKDSWPENARAENIISGCEFHPKGSVAVMGWKNSPGHNKNMLGDHEIMGVGFAEKRGCIKFCWTSGNQDEQEATVTVAMYGVPLPNATSAGVDTP